MRLRHLTALAATLLLLSGCPDKDLGDCSSNDDCAADKICFDTVCIEPQCGAMTVCGRECVNTAGDLEFCGGCDGCAELPGAVATQCRGGSCIYDCLGGFEDADGNLLSPDSNGCECQPTGDEVCDGLDNDCDGKIDGEDDDLAGCEAEDGAQGTCEGGGCVYVCKEGAEDVDGDLGTGGNGCECLKDGAEVCDGVDNDCDGDVDGEDEDLVEPVCGLSEGVCAGLGTECVDGAPLECSEDQYAEYAEVEGLRFQAGVETFCDGSDNNCNGTADELCCGIRDKTLVLAEDVGGLVASASSGEVTAALFVGEDGVRMLLVDSEGTMVQQVEITPLVHEALNATVLWSDSHGAFFVVHTFFVADVLVGLRITQVAPDGSVGVAFDINDNGGTQFYGAAVDGQRLLIGIDRPSSTRLLLVSTATQDVLGSEVASLARTEHELKTSRIEVIGQTAVVLGDAFSSHPLFPIDATTLWRVDLDGDNLNGDNLQFFPRETSPSIVVPSSGARIEQHEQGYRLYWVSLDETLRPCVVAQQLDDSFEEAGEAVKLVSISEESLHLAGVARLINGSLLVSGRRAPTDSFLGRGELWVAEQEGDDFLSLEATGSALIAEAHTHDHILGTQVLWVEFTQDAERRLLMSVVNTEGDLLCPWPN